MKFKLDENFGKRTQQLFIKFGHDVHTVRDENLQGKPDTTLYEICRREERCIISLDLDFSDTLRFPPETVAGIVIFRVPSNPSLILLEKLVTQFLHALESSAVENKLWIVEPFRIRIRSSQD